MLIFGGVNPFFGIYRQCISITEIQCLGFSYGHSHFIIIIINHQPAGNNRPWIAGCSWYMAYFCMTISTKEGPYFISSKSIASSVLRVLDIFLGRTTKMTAPRWNIPRTSCAPRRNHDMLWWIFRSWRLLSPDLYLQNKSTRLDEFDNLSGTQRSPYPVQVICIIQEPQQPATIDKFFVLARSSSMKDWETIRPLRIAKQLGHLIILRKASRHVHRDTQKKKVYDNTFCKESANNPFYINQPNQCLFGAQLASWHWGHKWDTTRTHIHETLTHSANGPWKKKFELYFPY